jgi:hypothetical protein
MAMEDLGRDRYFARIRRAGFPHAGRFWGKRACGWDSRLQNGPVRAPPTCPTGLASPPGIPVIAAVNPLALTSASLIVKEPELPLPLQVHVPAIPTR